MDYKSRTKISRILIDDAGSCEVECHHSWLDKNCAGAPRTSPLWRSTMDPR
jgi:hypothetical protein